MEDGSGGAAPVLVLSVAAATSIAILRTRRQRNGVHRFDNGDIYEGQWLRGKITGKGKYSWSKDGPSKGGSYEGQFVDGKKEGSGTFYFADGNLGAIYEGQYKDDKREGKGVFKWPTGSSYDGGWKQDKKHGHGVNTWANGDRYEGQYLDHHQHGHGKYSHPDGERYTGQWKAGKKHGVGSYIHESGELYEGQWEDDCKHGKGVMTSEYGKKTAGGWVRDWKAVPFKINEEDIICCHASWSSDKHGFSKKPMVRTEPPMAESDLRNSRDLKGNVAVIVRGVVPFPEKVLRAVEAGAVGVVVINNELDQPNDLFGMSSDVDFSIPVVSVSVVTGAAIKVGDMCSCL